MNARLLFTHALSPLHAGTGQGVGVIDLPIAREKATGLPFLPGSSVKGTLRDACEDKDKRKQAFGPETDNASEHAGAVQFSDQRLLLLPVRSLAGTFAWVTSPYVLQRLLRDAEAADVDGLLGVPAPPEEGCAVSNDGCQIRVGNKVVLEDLDPNAQPDALVGQWAVWLARRVFPGDAEAVSRFKARLCVVHDDVLNFLLDTATEITARIKLQDDKKTVQKGGLWYEEALPTETVLVGLVVATRVAASKATPNEVFTTVDSLLTKPLQFGGKATVGRGVCKLHMTRGQ